MFSLNLIFLLDGVAPRAKMNQQRARRFKSVKEANESRELKDILVEHWRKKAGAQIDLDDSSTGWDRNQITPGM